MTPEKNYDDAVENLIGGESPAGWISWLFDIQSYLISYNHLSDYTENAASEFSSRFWELKTFFVEIELEKNKNKLQIQ